MKDWRRSPEPPGMMGPKDAAYQVQANWGQPEELHHSDFDPASPLPNTTPAVFLSETRTSRTCQPQSTNGLSLYSMCLRVILRNISSVQDLGDMPYRNAKPILEECRIDQLIALEEASPHLLEHTEEIWKRNSLRDFIDLRKRYASATPGISTPKEPKSWRRLYFRTKGQIEVAKLEAAQRIKDKYAQHRAEKDAKKLVVSDRPLMLKAARSGGKRFGANAAGGVSKGQSLMNKARSGSTAQAKLTAPRNGRSPFGFKTQGRSKAVGAEIAPEAAGVGVRQTIKPMVAPRRIVGGGSEGLARMRQFSRPLPGSDAPSKEAKSTPRRSASGAATSTSTFRKGTDNAQRVEADASRKQLSDHPAESTGLPRLKPHEVAAAPPLTPTTSSGVGSRSRSNHSNTPGNSANGSSEPSTRQPALSPPPDMARAERRKLDFFGNARPSSSAKVANMSSRGTSPMSPGAPTVEIRGVKRARSSSGNAKEEDVTPSMATSRSIASGSNSKTVASLSATSPTATSFLPPASKSGVRVVQAKRLHAFERNESRSSLRNSPPTQANAKARDDSIRIASLPLVRQTTSDTSGSDARPVPVRQQSNSSHGSPVRLPVDHERLARASPAALSSIFAPPSGSHRSSLGNNSRTSSRR